MKDKKMVVSSLVLQSQSFEIIRLYCSESLYRVDASITEFFMGSELIRILKMCPQFVCRVRLSIQTLRKGEVDGLEGNPQPMSLLCQSITIYFLLSNLEQLMNLTLTNSPQKGAGVIRYSSSKIIQSVLPMRPDPPNNNANSEVIDTSCGIFLFRFCVDQEQIGQSEQMEEVYEQRRGIEAYNKALVTRLKEKCPNTEPKRKISVSLCRSEANSRTPQKQAAHLNELKGCVPRSKRVKTYAGCQQKRKQIAREHPSINIDSQIRSASNQKHALVNMHQMRQSMRPSASIPSTPQNSAKKSMNSAKKTKLTLSNNFKSQIHPEPVVCSSWERTKDCGKEQRAGHRMTFGLNQFNPVSNMVASSAINSQLVIDDSFMTARLANIYSEMNSGEGEVPKSNIVYYNNLMGNEQIWRNRENSERQPVDQGLKKEKEEIKILENQLSLNVSDSQNYSISKTEEQISLRSDFEREKIAQETPNKPIDKFKERRWIGDYAPTVKTFNNSQNRSEQESVVLARGPKPSFQPFPLITFQRGSVRDSGKEPTSEQFKRGCTSFGGDISIEHNEMEGRDRLQEWLSSPIEEDASSQN